MVRIGILTISDRASGGQYEDVSGPAIEAWLTRAIRSPWTSFRRIVPDGLESVRDALIALCDNDGADLVLTTGGTGPALRDVTPEATTAVCEKMLPGFGELMRATSLKFVPTAILSRQTAGIRGCTLIVNLPGSTGGVRDGLAVLDGLVEHAVELVRGEPTTH